MVTDTVSIDQFIEDNRIVSGSYRTDENPNMPDSRDMDHWKVTLKRGFTVTLESKVPHGAMTRTYTKSLTVFFSKGYGHKGAEPTTAEVLSCLADDSTVSDDFEDWCSDLGYDADSRKAEKTWKACQHIRKRLLNFLGGDLYTQLLYYVERE